MTPQTRHSPTPSRTSRTTLRIPPSAGPETNIHRAIIAQQMAPLVRTAYELTNYNPFASPWLMDRLSGQHTKQWAAKRRNSWPLPGIMADGDFLLIKHPFYAGLTPPKKGYIKIDWHPTNEDEPAGFCMSAYDYVHDSVKHDTHDCDDHFYLSYRTDGKQDYALTLRAPLSIGGGALLKLNKTRRQKAQENRPVLLPPRRGHPVSRPP